MEVFLEILEKVSEIRNTNLKLYFIVRHVKSGVPKYKKMLDKYSFDILRINVNSDLQSFLKNNIIQKVSELYTKTDLELKEFDITNDEKKCVYTYNEINNIQSFKTVLSKLNEPQDIQKITNIDEYLKNLWAICIRIADEENSIEFFRKIYSTKVGVVQGNQDNVVTNFFTRYNVDLHKLELLKGSSVSFDNEIDFLRYNENIFIVKKGNFEAIVNLEEEYNQTANACISEIETDDIIEGLDLLKTELNVSKDLNRKLAKIFSKNLHKVNVERLEEMKTISRVLNLNMKVNGNKLVITDKNDLNLVVKMLDDYYVVSMQKLNIYGSHSKDVIKKI